MRRAVAYTSDGLCTGSGEVISLVVQEERIRQFAAANDIEILAWFADPAHEANPLRRPGIQALLAFNQPCDLVLCERSWALSRSMASLEPFLKQLDLRGWGIEYVDLMWDCLSQQCRRRSRSLPVLPQVSGVFDAAGRLGRYHVATPVRLNFVHLVHPAGNQSTAGSER